MRKWIPPTGNLGKTATGKRPVISFYLIWIRSTGMSIWPISIPRNTVLYPQADCSENGKVEDREQAVSLRMCTRRCLAGSPVKETKPSNVDGLKHSSIVSISQRSGGELWSKTIKLTRFGSRDVIHARLHQLYEKILHMRAVWVNDSKMTHLPLDQKG